MPTDSERARLVAQRAMRALQRTADESLETIGDVGPDTAGASDELRDAKKAMERAEEIVAFLPDFAKSRVREVAAVIPKVVSNAELTPTDVDALEAIILPYDRPVVDIRDDQIFGTLPEPFASLVDVASTKQRLESAAGAIGCVLMPERGNPPYLGTGFVVGTGLVMTNRHVAEAFARGVGTRAIEYVAGDAALTTQRQRPAVVDRPRFRVEGVRMIHPYWDMALLEVPEIESPPLTLSAMPLASGSRRVVVIGYPARDRRNADDVQQRIFEGVFGVKRLAPGFATGQRETSSFGHEVFAGLHDASTLGGNSGSAVLDAATGEVFGLHFAGRYLDTNFYVPAAQLALDPRVFDAGVGFGNAARPYAAPPWQREWEAADRRTTERVRPAPSTTTPGRPRLPEDLAALVEAGRSRTYFDAKTDDRDRERYYASFDRAARGAFRRLHDLLERTHTRTPAYAPSRWVYPWVDLRPNRQLASIYSGDVFDVEEILLADLATDAERAERFVERMRASGGSESAEGVEDDLEDLLPYNCEHVVPQSWFSKREPMRGDLHHLFTCERRCNSFRGNRSYVAFEEEAVMEACGRLEGRVFEPKEGRGPVARATLYFLVRYPGDIDESDELTRDQIRTLRQWSREDAVDRYERHRNQAIFEIQGNRNPFIDFPDLVDSIHFDDGLG